MSRVQLKVSTPPKGVRSLKVLLPVAEHGQQIQSSLFHTNFNEPGLASNLAIGETAKLPEHLLDRRVVVPDEPTDLSDVQSLGPVARRR